MELNGLRITIVALTLFFATAAVALADSESKLPPEISPWTALGGGVVGAASGTGFAIWIAWYLITRVLPEREKSAAADREAAEKRCAEKFESQEKRHADHVAVKDLSYKEDMREAWKINREMSEKFASLVRELNDRSIAAMEKLSDKIDSGCKYRKE